jgi:hypothetical protein
MIVACVHVAKNIKFCENKTNKACGIVRLFGAKKNFMRVEQNFLVFIFKKFTQLTIFWSMIVCEAEEKLKILNFRKF